MAISPRSFINFLPWELELPLLEASAGRKTTFFN